jgi:TatD DNase family protein
MLIDTHIHLDLMEGATALIEEARQVGVGNWVVPGVAPGGWRQLVALVEAHNGLYAAPGVHPREAHSCGAEELEALAKLVEHPRVVAIGEVGLDRQVDCPMAVQETVFVEMIRLARKANKPLLIHTRRSTERVLELLQREGGGVKGIFHAFSGSLETARRVTEMGFLLGIGGVVTYKSAKRLPRVVCEVSETALVLETDAPDMTPEPYRGQQNRPAWLVSVAERVADLRGWSLDETARITSANAARLFDFNLEGHI